MSPKRFIGTRVRQLVRQGLLPRDAMRRAAWEWRYRQNPRRRRVKLIIRPFVTKYGNYELQIRDADTGALLFMEYTLGAGDAKRLASRIAARQGYRIVDSGQNPRISPTEVEIESYTYYKPSIGKRVTVPGYRKYLPIGGRNPGAAWHKSVVPEFDKLAAVSRAPSEKGFWTGMAQAHSASAETSEKLGMLNPGAGWHRKEAAAYMRWARKYRKQGLEEAAHRQAFLWDLNREYATRSQALGIPNPTHSRTNWLPVLVIAGLAALVWWLNRPKQTTT